MNPILSRIPKVLAAVLGVAALLAGGVVLHAERALSRRWDVPAPAVQAATDAGALARGAVLFRSECAGCHVGPSGRAAGKHMDDIPPFLGVVHSANLTAHPTAGVGALGDDQVARVVRNGVLPDGRRALIMPSYPRISDGDLAAVIGFLRSSDPMVSADATEQPRPAPSLVGKLILDLVVGAAPAPSEPTVAAPARGPTPEYGAYLANEVLHCYVCHTAGFGGHKLQEPGAYAGGFELRDGRGRPVLTPNITPDPETGVGRWSEKELARALRDGIRPDGSAILPPMGRFRELGDDELAAIAAYLKTVHPVRHPVARPAVAAAPVAAAALFEKNGCAACHGRGAPFREKLRPAATQPIEEVTARILHAERYNASTLMPTFAGTLDAPTARILAGYAQAEASAIAEQASAGEEGR
jgi:mono/diheme cytochrome c family protein